MLYYCEIILKLKLNTNILVSAKFTNELKNDYYQLVKTYDFIAASPVSIHRENLLKSSLIVNITNDYAVTLKADGERNFLFVLGSADKNKNGKIYIFDINFHFIDTGYKDEKYANTLIECEYVRDFNEIYMYDILFLGG